MGITSEGGPIPDRTNRHSDCLLASSYTHNSTYIQRLFLNSSTRVDIVEDDLTAGMKDIMKEMWEDLDLM